ncbi:hypothetical protein ACFY8W_18595 [Streptomyces sp. NPDC012637]|uniref:hypothetical protein n=1 Tax=Streptomyces sp. NPDC012637 TaxID=3364842 RepID=UPI0036E9C71C
MHSRDACVHCGQDWPRSYRAKGSGHVFRLCLECESLWLDGQHLGEETDLYLSEFLESQGIGWGDIEEVAAR